MMTEIALNILDVTENSIRAGASEIEIDIAADTEKDILEVVIKDNGCGMDEDMLKRVTDPFCTSRTTRKVGLGIPFYKQSAEDTGGSFEICSEVGKGTTVTAVFVLSHIDRMPLGDISSTIHSLITMNQHINFIYRYQVDDKSFQVDTRQLRDILGDVPFDTPEVSGFIEDYLRENKAEVDGANIVL